MWRTPKKLSYVWRLDACLLALLFLTCFTGGILYLRQDATRPSPISLEPYVFSAAVPLALGQGFFHPDVENIPPLEDFFDGTLSDLDTDILPVPLPRARANTSHSSEFYYYLNHTVAFIWHFSGISKKSLEPLAAILLGWSAMAAYGLMRFGMGRVLAFLLALVFAFSPPVLYMLPFLRDFSKAPFLLTLFVLLASIAKRKSDFRVLLFWSAFLGCFHGVALGFRQDALIFFPLVIAVLLFSGSRSYSEKSLPCLHQVRGRITRVLAVISVYLLFFAFAGSPMLGKMEGGADPYHPLVQGFSTKHMQNLGLGQAMYTPLASGHDNYAFATYYHHFRHADNAPQAHFDYDTDGSQIAARQWLVDMGVSFPADQLARIYASVLRTLRYADAFTPPLLRSATGNLLQSIVSFHTRLATHLHHFGLFYALAFLSITAAQSPFIAFTLLLLLLYVCGYAGLQSELRHTFHLCFVPLWILGFLLSRAGGVAQSLRLRCASGRSTPRLFPMKAFTHTTLFLASALFAIFLPMFILRLYQHQAAAAILEPCIRADRTPQGYRQRTVYNWTFFDLTTPRSTTAVMKSDISALYSTLALTLQVRYPRLLPPRYVVIEFDGDHVPSHLLVRYGTDYPWGNFTQMTRLPEIRNPSGSIFHAFPIYEMVSVTDAIRRSTFEGIAIPTAFARNVKGIYTIDRVTSLRFLMPLTWSSDDDLSRPLFRRRPSQLPLHLKVDLFSDATYYDFLEHQPSAFYTAAKRASRSGRHAEAALLLSMCLLFPTDANYRQYLAERLCEENAPDLAYLAVKDDRVLPPPFSLSRISLLRRLTEGYVADYSRTCNPDSLVKARLAFESLLALGPESAAKSIIEMARPPAAVLDIDSWRNSFRDIMILFPDYEGAMFLAYSILGSHHTADKDVELWAAVTQARPDSCLPWCRLTMALERTGAHDDATRAYATALNNCPDSVDLSQHIFLPNDSYFLRPPK